MKQCLALYWAVALGTIGPTVTQAQKADGQGFVLDYVVQGADGRKSHALVSIDGSRLRIDSPGADEPSVVIFHADRDELFLIDTEQKAHMRIEGTRVRAVAAQMVDVTQIPADVLLERMPGAPRLTTDLKATGTARVVSGYRCDVYKSYRQNEPFRETCLATWSAISPRLSEVAGTLDSFRIFGEGLVKAFLYRIPIAGSLESPLHDVRAKYGMPVAAVELDRGNPALETLLTSVQERALSPETFEAPKDSAEKTPPAFSR